MARPSGAHLRSTCQGSPDQPRHIAEGGQVPQEDEKGVDSWGGHALGTVERPAVSPAVVTVSAQQPVVALVALSIVVGDVPGGGHARDVCNAAVFVDGWVVGCGAVVPGCLATLQQQ